MRPLKLDLFSGLGCASEVMRRGGWEVVRVDDEPAVAPDICADLSRWSWGGRQPALVWASPPCTEFSRESMPWCRTGRTPSVALALAAKRIIEETRPTGWVVENVKGAVKYLDPIFGRFRASFGPFFLGGNLPPLRVACKVLPFKEKLSSRQRAERAKVPEALSLSLALTLERELI